MLILGSSALTWLLAAGCSKPAETPAPAAAAPAAQAAAAVATGAAAAAPAAPEAAAALAAHAAAPAPAVPAAAGPGGVQKFGEALSAAPTLTASTVLADPAKWNDKDIKLTGQVSGVCQNKGCWMTVGTGEPGTPAVRITFQGYGFFVPKDSMGKTATVEGRFKVTTLSVAQAQHYADDAAKEGAVAKKVTEPQKTLALVARGVELL